MLINTDVLAHRARIDVTAARDALAALAHGQSAFIVVGGKMTAGKDTVAPAVRDHLTGHGSDIAMLRYGNFMRADLRPGTDILREDTLADVDPRITARRISVAMNLPECLATSLVETLRPEMIASEGTLTPESRTDGIRTVLQNLGDDWRCADDEDYWARIAAQAAIEEIGHGRSVILTGGRFLPDVDLPLAAAGLLVRLDVTRQTQLRRLAGRDNLPVTPELLAALDHQSETALDAYPNFHLRLDNDEDGVEELAGVIATVNRGVDELLTDRQRLAA